MVWNQRSIGTLIAVIVLLLLCAVKDTLNNSPEIRIKRMENGISIKNQTKASKQEGNHGLFHLKRA